MPFITQGKTNIKYILIVVVLAVISGGGILGYQYWWIGKENKEQGETEVIDKMINKLLPAGFEKWAAEYSNYSADLNEDNLQEIIITSIYPMVKESWSERAYLVIATLLNEKGDYKKIADFYFDQGMTKDEKEIFNLRFGGAPTVSVETDINDDGWKEMGASWPLSAVDPMGSGRGHAFLSLDLSTREINYLKIRNKEGEIAPAIFKAGFDYSENTYLTTNIKTSDIDKNGKWEVIEINQWQKLSEPDKKIKEESWEANVYEWDGSLFSYNRELSSSGLGVWPGWEHGE